MKSDRRHSLKRLAAGALAGTWGLPGAWAQQAWPSRPIRIVVPYAAGGSVDIMARTMGEQMSKQWGQPIVVDNKPGAGGMLGADAVSKAESSGHTLLLTLSALVQSPALYAKPPYDPLRDFAPISELATMHIVMVALPNLPYSDFKGLLQNARASGAPLLYGTYGQGSSQHLQMETFGRATKLPVQHVAYKGETPLVGDMLGGHMPVGFISATTARQYTRTGKLRAIAVMGKTRSPLLPDVPTATEAGVAGFERVGWVGLLAPAATPSAVVDKISADVNAVLARPEFRERMVELGVLLRGTSPASFAAHMKDESAYWTDLIRTVGVKLE